LCVDAIVEPLRLFAGDGADCSNQRPIILLGNPRGFGRLVILDVAVTGIDIQSRTSDDAPDRPLNVRCEQKITEYHRVVDENGFQFVPTLFFHTGQLLESIKQLIKEQIRHELIFFEGEAKQSEVKSIMNWWLRCISMVITETASKNIAFKAAKMSETAFETQAAFVTP